MDEKYYLTVEQIERISQWKSYQKPFAHVHGRNSISPTLTARGAGEEHSGMILYSEELEDTTNLQNECLYIKNFTKQGYLEAHEGDGVVVEDLRIRKLTPKECFRLMGFNDCEFERASKVNSNAQLYKQAGNSIVVNVLQNIFKNLLMKEGKIMEKKEEVKIISYETNLMIDLEKLAKEEPDLFNDLVKDYPVELNTKIIIEVKA